VVTAEGGGAKDLPMAMAAWICLNFAKPMPRIARTTHNSMVNIRNFIGKKGGAFCGLFSEKAI
jgi:hypothetical protein